MVIKMVKKKPVWGGVNAKRVPQLYMSPSTMFEIRSCSYEDCTLHISPMFLLLGFLFFGSW